MSPRVQHVLSWAGSSLGFISTIFVASRLYDYAGQIDLARFDKVDWFKILVFLIIYAAANIVLVAAWWHLLNFFETAIKFCWAVKIYGQSQLAKYVPGNIFHLAGRQALGLAAGLPGWTLAKSVLWELGLIAIAGLFFGVLALPLVWPIVSVPVSVIVFVLLVSLAVMSVRYGIGLSVAWALGLQVIFLLIFGGVSIVTLALVDPSVMTGMALPAFLGAYVIAWLAGLVTPGAPAGVGVRELVLLFLLGGVVAEADLLLAVVLGRIVTVGGDVLFFSVASLKRS